MGSSLTVTPAADIPKDVCKFGRLVIVNLQTTPLDKYAYLRINGLCEDVMKRLAVKLKLKVNNFILKRLIQFNKTPKQWEFRGIDKRNVPFSFFKKVSAKVGEKLEVLKGEPYHVDNQNKKGHVEVEFYRFLGEPNLVLQLDQLKEGILEL